VGQNQIEVLDGVDLSIPTWTVESSPLVVFVGKGAPICREMDMSPGPPVLEGGRPSSILQFDVEHQHKVLRLLTRELDQGLPIQRVRRLDHLPFEALLGSVHGSTVPGAVKRIKTQMCRLSAGIGEIHRAAGRVGGRV
jgi:hypothetical protein